MANKNYEMLFPIKGGNEIEIADKERDIRITFTISIPFDPDNKKVFDFIVNDIVKQMNEVTEEYDRFNGYKVIDPTAVE